MADLGLVWTEVVDCVRERNIPTNNRDKSRILRNEDRLFSKQCEQIVSSIGQLREFLLESRSAYLLAGTGIPSAMTDTDRDQVDASSDEISIRSQRLITTFKDSVLNSKLTVGGKEHFSLVGDGLEKYLKQVVGIHSEMRAVRFEKERQLKQLSKLELNSRASRVHEIGHAATNTNTSARLTESQLKEKAVTAAALSKSSHWEDSDDEESLSGQESQQLEMENERLLEQLTSLQNSVDQVTTKVVKISELQEIFSEKVLQQSADIELVHTQTVNTTENIKGGNEAVRKAIQNKASYRVIILFILLVFSFSLLFLDWYND